MERVEKLHKLKKAYRYYLKFPERNGASHLIFRTEFPVIPSMWEVPLNPEKDSAIGRSLPV